MEGQTTIKTPITELNIQGYRNKTIKSIYVYDNGRTLIFTFTDNTSLELESYKYSMNVIIPRESK
jgi:hypothetical protein